MTRAMSTIRVIYHIDVEPTQRQQFEQAWAEIVAAHQAAGHGALESMLLHDPQLPGRYLAISRWSSRANWELHQADSAHPEAYARLRQVSQTQRKEVFEEIALRRAELG
jgi:quinol monooxygenase YgiN